jgi:hypothetical protein
MALFSKKEDPAAPAVIAAAVPPASDHVTKAEFSALDARLARLTDVMEQSVNRPVVVQAPAAPLAVEPDVTDEEIDTALADGKGGASRIKQLLDQKIGRATRAFQAELDTFRNYGTTMLGTLAERSATQDMDPQLAKRFDREIRELVNQCDPALRGHPETWKTAYETVCGRHTVELRQEAIEADRRQHAEEEQARAALPGKDARPASPSADDVPTIQELAGEFPHLGDMSEDEFIRKMNRGKSAKARYKDWADYNARGHAIDAQLRALRDGDDDGGEGAIPALLQ